MPRRGPTTRSVTRSARSRPSAQKEVLRQRQASPRAAQRWRRQVFPRIAAVGLRVPCRGFTRDDAVYLPEAPGRFADVTVEAAGHRRIERPGAGTHGERDPGRTEESLSVAKAPECARGRLLGASQKAGCMAGEADTVAPQQIAGKGE